MLLPDEGQKMDRKCVERLRGQQQGLEEPVLESQQRHRRMCPARVTVLRVHTMTSQTLLLQLTKACQNAPVSPRDTVCCPNFSNSWKTGKPQKVTGKANSEEYTEKPSLEKAFRKIITSLVTK